MVTGEAPGSLAQGRGFDPPSPRATFFLIKGCGVGPLTGLVIWPLLTGVVTELHPIKRSLYKNIEY